MFILQISVLETVDMRNVSISSNKGESADLFSLAVLQNTMNTLCCYLAMPWSTVYLTENSCRLQNPSQCILQHNILRLNFCPNSFIFSSNRSQNGTKHILYVSHISKTCLKDVFSLYNTYFPKSECIKLLLK